jgi:hypothetical protein
MMRTVLAIAVVAAVLGAACRTTHEETPTEPDTSGLDVASLIPDAPTPSPSVSPSPPPDGGPLPAHPPPGGGTTSGACGPPAPPPVSRVNVKVHLVQPTHKVLDATPLVGPDVSYCRAIGYADGRSFCPVRPDGHPEREACEALRVGRASDTGRLGPTWSADGRPCQGAETRASCLNHPDNQYLVYAYGSGTFRACVTGGVCGEVVVP